MLFLASVVTFVDSQRYRCSTEVPLPASLAFCRARIGFYSLRNYRETSHAWGPNAHVHLRALIHCVKLPGRVSIGRSIGQ